MDIEQLHGLLHLRFCIAYKNAIKSMTSLNEPGHNPHTFFLAQPVLCEGLFRSF